jgi:hypothetical protein
VKHALVWSLCFLSMACSRIETQTPRRYLCDPDAPQCPGGWKCTLDGFCTNPDAGVDVQCDENADCTGGWLCALSGRCVDPAIGRPLPCNEPTDCPGKWKCGLIGQCLDPDAGAPWPCIGDEDCTGQGWRCGVGPICYEREKAEDVGCRRDAGNEDCADGWRCGLEEVCHDRAVGFALLCDSDNDCEQQWRCSAAHRCVDAANDAWRPTNDAGVGTVTGLPSVIPPRPELIATTGSGFSLAGDGNARLTAFVTDGGLTVIATGRSDLGRFTPDGGAELAALVASTALPASPTSLTFGTSLSFSTAPRLWVASNDQALRSYDFQAPHQLVARGVLALGFTATHLRVLRDGTVIAFNDTRLAEILSNGTVLTAFQATTGRITEVLLVDASLLLAGNTFTEPQLQSLLVLTTTASMATGWSSTSGGTSWREVVLDKRGEYLPQFIGSFDNAQGPIGVGGTRDGGPASLLGLTFGVATLPDTVNRLAQSSALPPLLLVTSTSSLALGSAPPRALWVGTPPNDGGRPDWVIFASGDGGTDYQLSARPTVARLDQGMVISDDDPGRLARAGHGLAWVGAGNGLGLSALVPAEIAGSTGGRASQAIFATTGASFDAATCASDPQHCDGLLRRTTCARGGTPWFWCRQTEGTGLTGVRINGRPDWQLFDLHSLNSSNGFPPYAVFGVDAARAEPNVFVGASRIEFGALGPAAAVTTGDGGTQLVLGAADRLFWADASKTRDPSQYVNDVRTSSDFRFALTPQPGGSITSVAPMAVDAVNGPSFAEGFLISSGRVYRYTADNEVVWRAEEFTIGSAEAIAVWVDGRRGRVVFRDGTVYALPSRVRLSDALSAGASSVLSVESFCGQTFALTAAGLHRLVGDGARVATWERVELGVAADFSVGKLLAEENSLLVMLPDGKSRLLSGFDCAP